jgi:WXG100 family type VII secretion target
MTSIHVNTDVMRQLGNRYIQACETLRNLTIPELQGLAHNLEGDWQGISRQHYDNSLQQFQQSAYSLLNWGEEIGRHLYQVAQQFDEADQS